MNGYFQQFFEISKEVSLPVSWSLLFGNAFIVTSVVTGPSAFGVCVGVASAAGTKSFKFARNNIKGVGDCSRVLSDGGIQRLWQLFNPIMCCDGEGGGLLQKLAF